MIEWTIKKFYELSLDELYEIVRLRNEVFIVEQNCVFQDLDNKDQKAIHLMGRMNKQLVAYTRLLAPGISYSEASIGRVITSSLLRRTGSGKLLMQQSINELENIYGKIPIRIGAQAHLKKFYESFQFVQSSNVYDEDGIDHIEMTRS